MKAIIGNSLIPKLKPKEKQYDVRDINLKGFLIRVTPTGKMSYVCQYGRGRRMNIGQVGVITPAQARDKAKVRYLDKEEENKLKEALTLRDNKVKEKRANGNQWRKERGYDYLPDLHQFAYPDYLSPMIVVSLNTGLRRGELFSLTWNDIDFTIANLTVRGDSAKSGKTRHIPLNAIALQALEDWRQVNDSDALIFYNVRTGAAFNHVKESWAGLLENAGIKNFRWHDMRHHFASKLVMAGVDLNTVRELLGHSDIKMTLRYAHLAPEHKANAVAKLV